MQHTSKNGLVFEPTTHHPTARLYDYDIDGDMLKPAHMKWLDDNIVRRIRGSGDTWRLSLSGSTDRLGASTYNVELSKRRVMNIQLYLSTRPGLAGVTLIFDASWEGELPASLHDDDETPDRWERAVLVTLTLFAEPRPRPLPPQRPRNSSSSQLLRAIPPCVTKATCPMSRDFAIKTLKGYEVGIPGILVSPTGGTFTFLLRDRTNGYEATYEFRIAKGVSISPLPAGVTGEGTFRDFTTAYPTRVVDFGTMADIVIPSIPQKPGPFRPLPNLATLTVSYDKGGLFAARQEITNLDTGSTPVFSSLPGLSLHSGSFVLVSACKDAAGARRY